MSRDSRKMTSSKQECLIAVCHWHLYSTNEFEYLADRGGHGGHLDEKFVKKYCS